jgi:hypothetical protein
MGEDPSVCGVHLQHYAALRRIYTSDAKTQPDPDGLPMRMAHTGAPETPGGGAGAFPIFGPLPYDRVVQKRGQIC